MKKIICFLLIACGLSLTSIAQEVKTTDEKTKVKKTSTLGQKLHNTFSKNKKYKGYKTKHKKNGKTHKQKVELKKGEVKTKED